VLSRDAFAGAAQQQQCAVRGYVISPADVIKIWASELHSHSAATAMEIETEN